VLHEESAGLNPSGSVAKFLRPDIETWEEKFVQDPELITF